MWYKDGELVYSTPLEQTPNPNLDFFVENQILMPGIFDQIVLTPTIIGEIFYFYGVMNISMPDLLPPDITTLEQARQELFNLALGEWMCVVNNSLGTASVTYVIRECGE